jgi:hypothetical protein
MKEQNVMHRVMLALSQAGATVFRQNVGQAVVGGVEWIRQRKTVTVNPGDAVVRGARVFHAGFVGQGDVVGWFPIEITPEMVGRKVAVVLWPEVKKEEGGRRRPEQEKFCDRVVEDGGISGFVRSPEEAVAMLQEFTR